MAIHPIDLQTLYMQIDKVGKTQAFQDNSLNTQQSLAATQAIKKQEQQKSSVSEISTNEAQSAKVGDRENFSQEESRRQQGRNQSGENQESQEKFISPKDPRLGSFLDITG